MKRRLIALGCLAVGLVGLAYALSLRQHKILFIDSYNVDYPWSAEITEEVIRVTKRPDVDLKIARMDSKNHPDEASKAAKAQEIKTIIETWKPDVIIACDDNASKYVIAPFVKDSDTPVVFCGINGDSSIYGFPTPTITGIEEVPSFDVAADILRKSGAGKRIGFLSSDNESDTADVPKAQKRLGMKFDEVHFVKTFVDWKRQFTALQQRSDIVFLFNNAGITDWNDAEAVRFVENNIRVPTASLAGWMAPYAVVVYARFGSEQGHWAAETAMKIVDGAKPSDFPVAINREGALIVNKRLAAKVNANIPPEYLGAAAKVIE